MNVSILMDEEFEELFTDLNMSSYFLKCLISFSLKTKFKTYNSSNALNF